MRRISWLALAVAVVALVATGLSRISFNIDILKLLPTHLPQVEGLSLFLKNFAQPRELVVTLEAKDSDTAEAAADELAELFRQRTDLVSRAASRPPWEKNPG